MWILLLGFNLFYFDLGLCTCLDIALGSDFELFFYAWKISFCIA